MDLKWSTPEKVLISPHWLNKENDHYIYCQFAEDFYATFEIDPYCTRTVNLIKILPGYGYDSVKFAVLEEWRQEGHPSYSDCYEHTLTEFNDINSAIKAFNERVSELEKEYPQ